MNGRDTRRPCCQVQLEPPVPPLPDRSRVATSLVVPASAGFARGSSAKRRDNERQPALCGVGGDYYHRPVCSRIRPADWSNVHCLPTDLHPCSSPVRWHCEASRAVSCSEGIKEHTFSRPRGGYDRESTGLGWGSSGSCGLGSFRRLVVGGSLVMEQTVGLSLPWRPGGQTENYICVYARDAEPGRAVCVSKSVRRARGVAEVSRCRASGTLRLRTTFSIY